mmetsp:Transcript_2593/g.4690  ORF Transcript_2593/g.4690 Transcript_2593/m.4690 type:complete len:367 (+) Transcript_2593:2206-3306(+)
MEHLRLDWIEAVELVLVEALVLGIEQGPDGEGSEVEEVRVGAALLGQHQPLEAHGQHLLHPHELVRRELDVVLGRQRVKGRDRQLHLHHLRVRALAEEDELLVVHSLVLAVLHPQPKALRSAAPFAVPVEHRRQGQGELEDGARERLDRAGHGQVRKKLHVLPHGCAAPLPVAKLADFVIPHVKQAHGVVEAGVASALNGGEDVAGQILRELPQGSVKPPDPLVDALGDSQELGGLPGHTSLQAHLEQSPGDAPGVGSDVVRVADEGEGVHLRVADVRLQQYVGLAGALVHRALHSEGTVLRRELVDLLKLLLPDFDVRELACGADHVQELDLARARHPRQELVEGGHRLVLDVKVRRHPAQICDG